MSKLNVITSDCALCSNKDVDTIEADCHLLYRGEWINQIEPVCFDCIAKRVVKKEVKEVKEPKKVVEDVTSSETLRRCNISGNSPKMLHIQKPAEDVTSSEPKPAIKHPKPESVSKPKKAY